MEHSMNTAILSPLGPQRVAAGRMGSQAVAAASGAGVGFGAPRIDARLGGGLARAALHEIYAAGEENGSAAAGFALLIGLRAMTAARPLVWVQEERGERRGGRLHGPGFVELGADPDAVVVVTAPDLLALLRAGADVVQCAAVGVLILEPWGKAAALDLTASRRLALAAARSGVMTLVVRVGAEPVPSAAQTRWLVAAAPSRALAAGAPGLPVFDISLLRHRGGVAAFDTCVEWDRDRRAFRDAPVSGVVPALAAGGTRDPAARRAA